MEPSEKISLRDFFEEKLKHLVTRIDAVEAKFDAAIIAQEKATASAFIASEKAISKSEDSQRELNIKNNEFRAQLKDQADILISRAEAMSMFKNVEDKLEGIKHETEIKFDLSRKDVQGLRESRSEGGGKSAGQAMSWAVVLAVVGLLGTLVSIAVGLSILLRN